MTEFEKGDPVVVIDLRTGLRHKGRVDGVLADRLQVEYDDGTIVKVGAAFVRHDDSREPTDTEIYGAGSE